VFSRRGIRALRRPMIPETIGQLPIRGIASFICNQRDACRPTIIGPQKLPPQSLGCLFFAAADLARRTPCREEAHLMGFGLRRRFSFSSRNPTHTDFSRRNLTF